MIIITFLRAILHALIYVFQGRPVITPRWIRDYRESKCEPCRFFDKGKCRLCHCYLEAKWWVASESCPDKPPRWKSL